VFFGENNKLKYVFYIFTFLNDVLNTYLGRTNQNECLLFVEYNDYSVM